MSRTEKSIPNQGLQKLSVDMKTISDAMALSCRLNPLFHQYSVALVFSVSAHFVFYVVEKRTRRNSNQV